MIKEEAMSEPLAPREARDALIREMIQISRRSNPSLAEEEVAGISEILVAGMSDREVFQKIESKEEIA
jgi:hypothetical protein